MLAADLKKDNVSLVCVCVRLGELFSVPGKYSDADLFSQETESRLDPVTTTSLSLSLYLYLLLVASFVFLPGSLFPFQSLSLSTLFLISFFSLLLPLSAQ